MGCVYSHSIVAGGLDEPQRKALFEAHVADLRARSGAGGGPVRVDVSDLGLTMDDLSGPMGGL